MDIRSYFGEASTPSTSASRLSSTSSEDESEVESLDLEVSPSKKHCTSTMRLSTPTAGKKNAKHRSTTSTGNTKWEKDLSWLEYNKDWKGAFCKVCRISGKLLQ